MRTLGIIDPGVKFFHCPLVRYGVESLCLLRDQSILVRNVRCKKVLDLIASKKVLDLIAVGQ